jgi:hypothetical protein
MPQNAPRKVSRAELQTAAPTVFGVVAALLFFMISGAIS